MNARPSLCATTFLPLLEEYGIDELERVGGTVYGLWPDLRLAYMNPAWSRFAAANGGEAQFAKHWGLGRCIVDAIAQPLRPFFVANYGRCLDEMRPWEHTYQCSSADRYREFHMTVFPLRQREGLLVVNSLRIEGPHKLVAQPPLDQRYRTADGIICQCSHCRRTRRVDDESIWDWVAEWVKQTPDRVSHSICPECFGFHYSKSRALAACFVESFSTTDEPTRPRGR